MNAATPETSAPSVILLIDDNEANLGVLAEYLKTLGFKILTARNGGMGLQRAQLAKPDLILLDVLMPGLDGFEVCRRLKADPDTQDIPVIFITALESVEDTVKGFAAGGVDYITKPIRQDDVFARVTTHLSLRKTQQQLQENNAHLEATLNALPDMLFELDRDGRIYDFRAPRPELLLRRFSVEQGVMFSLKRRQTSLKKPSRMRRRQDNISAGSMRSSSQKGSPGSRFRLPPKATAHRRIAASSCWCATLRNASRLKRNSNA